MTFRLGPRSAIWLLERLGDDPRSQALIGDLAEQFAQGRSRLWFWHQTLGAVAIRSIGILRTHGPSFFGALLVGCALNWFLELCCSSAFKGVYENLPDIKLHPWSAAALLRMSGMVANTLFWCALCVACAWVVTRVHRAHQRAVLVAFVAIQIGLRVPALAPLARDVAVDPGAAITFATQVILTGMHGVYILVAGLWAIRSNRYARRDRWIHVVEILWVAETLATTVLFATRRVGEQSYGGPEDYLSMYVLEIVGGLYLALLLWRSGSTAPVANHLV